VIDLNTEEGIVGQRYLKPYTLNHEISRRRAAVSATCWRTTPLRVLPLARKSAPFRRRRGRS
jgi:hypothetical protein